MGAIKSGFSTALILCSSLLLALSACGPSTTYDTGGSGGGNNNGGGGGTQTGLGYSWQAGASGTTSDFKSLAFGNGRWVAVGTGAGLGVIGESSDGLAWTLTQENSTQYYDLHNVAFGNGTFVALSSLGVLISADGVNWAAATVPTSNGTTPYPQSLTAAAYGNGRWVAVDDFFYTENGLGIWTSTDGSSWNVLLLNTPYAQPTAIAWGNGLYVIVGYGGLLLTSPDGTNWSNRSFSSGVALMGITYANGQFVAVGQNGQILVSPDGTGNWTTYSAGVIDYKAVAYGGGQFLATGQYGASLSSDGRSWTSVTSYLPNSIASSSLNGVAYGNSAFVVAGDSGAVAVSH